MNSLEALKYYYNYDCYRSNQQQIVESLINKQNTIAILPTGGGKSICFQIPGLLSSGISIIVTPLISLMDDQVYELSKINIKAISINSTKTKQEISDIYNNINNYKFLYVSPERLLDENFINSLKDVIVSYIIIDEAHCIETWGSSFRTSYQKIYCFIKKYNATIGCFSATATRFTLNKIIEILHLEEYNLFKNSLSRNNLLFEIIKTKNKLVELKKLLLLKGVKIIYCSTVKTVEHLYNHLKTEFNLTMYHGRLDNRKYNQDEFIKGKKDIIIATNAFGMGINKSDVRYVIHYEISSSIEDYYQEAGRAGRDNKSSKCIILYNSYDLNVHYYLAELLKDEKTKNKKKNELYYLEKFINTKKCLEVEMKEYFNEESYKCMKCSNCINKNPLVDISKILLDYDNILNNYNITNNNYFLITEHYNKLKIKYKKYDLFLLENKFKVKLIYNFKLELLLTKLFNNKISIKTIIKIVYFNPYDYSSIAKNKELLILNNNKNKIINIVNNLVKNTI